MLINADGAKGFVQIRTPEDGSVVRVDTFASMIGSTRGAAEFAPERARELALKLLLAAGHSQAEIVMVRQLLLRNQDGTDAHPQR